MLTCFVIQPFDFGKFDKRYEAVFKPGIEDAGLEPYRVDRDPAVEVPINAIEDGIRNAAICVADITTDNPNVWYELGFAFATGRPVVMLCSNERTGKKFPFDIQHRAIINYQSEAPQDFQELSSNLTKKLKALLTKSETIRQIAETEQVAPSQGLSQPELYVLANLAGDVSFPDSVTSLYSLKHGVERSGLTSVGFSLGLRRLISKQFVQASETADERGEPYQVVELTERGWDWVESHESLFVIRRGTPQSDDEEIPF
ncbi:hypothetical protein KBZ18_10115 [Synechococcus sp. Cruz-9H2]|uniref:nucleoside 2-deoxyribosyltransferase n=1 Tax=unclassified Synechococcus TaxID=2626047 RepID=UPI0020CBC2FE|nr:MULTISPECIES: nucleoside 2-deoxyribosyltransferase [unclassified Synechococcus]MCP9819847.1 hypothetical protein [Synechococcus sp. Cruz-9H2]MCP9844087.1 hypothetical protein [Synechococcus sp. Edmonson 11F2]MCP9856277.1 hypothetical protein [Synechococcus sp. Cruz-9C9]MCP9863562.1 hypothetical protein [Synechococcus sp. Cruz-7E5]MCP9870758.1 hypothetical protein [Synechococcus sp. Cruz-7B9]